MISGFSTENLGNLISIGTKPEDYESIPSVDKPYTILGKGNFGYAEKMKSRLNNKIYAVKKLPYKKEISKSFFRETELMLSLNNEYVVRLYGYFLGIERIEKVKDIYKDHKDKLYKDQTENIKMFFLVMDYMENGSLENYYNLSIKEHFIIEQKFIIKILKQILKGLIYIHSNMIWHRDIKLDNILLDDKNNIKISDFGISAKAYSNGQQSPLDSNYTLVGRRDFAAPEILKGIKYDFKVDIFSAGLSMLYLMSSQKPISFKKPNNIREISFNFIRKVIYNKYFINLIQKMISEESYSRPSAFEALQELNYIDVLLNEPNNIDALNYLNAINNKSNSTQMNNPQIEIQYNNSGNYDQYNVYQNDYNFNQFHENYNFLNSQQFQNAFNGNNNKQKSQLSQNFPKRTEEITNFGSNTSIKCILKCLYYCLIDDIDNIIQTINFANFMNQSFNIVLYILNVVKFMEKEPVDKDDLNFLNMNIQLFRLQMSNISQKFSGNAEIPPIFVYIEIFSKLNEESRKYHLGSSNIINHLDTIPGLDKKKFPIVYKDIKQFISQKQSPFVDLFYFIRIESLRCIECDNIIEADIKWSCFLELDGTVPETIPELLRKYFYVKCLENNYLCKNCNAYVRAIKCVSFLSKPKYFVLNFRGKNMIKKDIDKEIYLSDYSYPEKNIGPKKYILFAFIKKNEKNEYNALIKKNQNFYLYNSETFIECNLSDIYNDIPNIVIYKSIDEK